MIFGKSDHGKRPCGMYGPTSWSMMYTGPLSLLQGHSSSIQLAGLVCSKAMKESRCPKGAPNKQLTWDDLAGKGAAALPSWQLMWRRSDLLRKPKSVIPQRPNDIRLARPCAKYRLILLLLSYG